MYERSAHVEPVLGAQAAPPERARSSRKESARREVNGRNSKRPQQLRMSVASKSLSRDPSLELLGSTKKTTFKFSPGAIREPDPVDQDLREVHKHEKRVFALNDQFVALNRVIRETANSNELMQNELRKQKLRIHERQEALRQKKEEMQPQVDEYNALCQRQEKANKDKEAFQAKAQELRAALRVLGQEMKESARDVAAHKHTDTSEYDEHDMTDRRITTRLEFVRKRKEELLQRIKASDEKRKEAEAEENKLMELKDALQKKLKRVMARVDAAQKQLNAPCDQLKFETALVDILEKGATELEKHIDSSMEDELAEDIFDSRDRYEAFMTIVIQRRRVLRQAQAELMSLKISLGLVEKARSTTSGGTSVMSAMVNMQSKLAQDVVKRVFDKLKKREAELDSLHPEIDELEAGFKEVRPIIEDKWRDKMKRVEELTKELAEYEQLEIQIAVEKQKTNDLIQKHLDKQYAIHHLKQLNTKCAHLKDSIPALDDGLNAIRQRITEKQKVLAEAESAVAKKRESVASFKAQVDSHYAEVAEQEKSTHAIESEVDDAFLELEAHTFKAARDYDAQSVCKLLAKVQ